MPIDIPDELRATRKQAAAIARRRDALIATPVDRADRLKLVGLDADLGAIIDRLRIDPCDASPEVPLVLLPVRIETKLRGATTLQVRITPDEVHIDPLARTLTEAEIAAGRAYWTVLWSDAASTTAWPALVEVVGLSRAGWVAKATAPNHQGDHGPGGPAFGDPPAEVSAGTVARCLPDQFVVRVFPAGSDPITRVGRPIARDLPISPVALSDDSVVDAGALKVPAGSEWTVDFAKAVEAGMGVEVELPAGTTRLEAVVVTGTRNSVSEQDNAADLAELLISHRYSDGAGLLPYGTPTNNADRDRSPYRPEDAAGAPPLDPPAPTADATAIAALLGIDPAAVQDIADPGAAPSTLDATQAAANASLWYATWHRVLDDIDSANVSAVTPATIESARRTHRDSVRGAGRTSALRIGAQPYGILPVSDLAAWKPRAGELTAGLATLVQRVLTRWTARSADLPHVGPGDTVTDAQMLELMGTSPLSTSVRVRPAVKGPQVGLLASATGADPAIATAELQLAKAMLAQYSIDVAKVVLPPSLHQDSRLVSLPLVSDRDAAVIADILADKSPKVDSVLQALLDLAWDAAKQATFRAAPSAFIPPLLQLLDLGPELNALVRAAAAAGPMGDAIAAAPAAGPQEFFAAADRARATVRFDGQPTDQLSLAAVEPIAEARTSLAQVALDLGTTDEARWVGQNAVSGLLDAFAARWEVHDAMIALGAAPLDERRIATASALDIASHRVDAWATGIALDRQGRLAANEGTTIGAFGYVEDVRLGSRSREADGWLHAPSSTHAVAAGILASAHRSNIGAKAGEYPFAIDLSSRRGTELRRVLEGIKAGQSIGALLGYQIERGLTGSAARFQLSLRELAPLNTDELGTELPVGERTARVAAASVVDGAELLRRFPLESLTGPSSPLGIKLGTQPANAYVPPGGWDAITQEEWDSVAAALRSASETLDAVSDALLAESVLHYATGNAARASAAMDAVSSGGGVDPDLGILGVRQSGRTLTHAAFAVVPEKATGWSKTRPRAIAEPRLEAWAARRLGDPADIVVTDAGGVRTTLDTAGFAALDLVFADDLRSLDRDLRAAIPGMGDAPLAVDRDPGWPAPAQSIVAAATLAGSLRAIASGASPLAPEALVPSGAIPQHRVDTDELFSRCDALLGALEAALSVGAATITAIDPGSRAIEEDQVVAVRDAVAPLAAFGIPLVPDTVIPTNAGWALGAWQTGSARLAVARDALADVRAVRPEPLTTAQLIDRARSIVEGVLGDGFRVLPVLEHIGTDAAGGAVRNDLATAIAEPAFPQPSRSRIAGFVRDEATVRAGIARLAEAQLIGGAIGRGVDLRVLQLSGRGADGTPDAGTDRWLAGPLPDDRPWPATPATHAVVELVGDPADSSDRIAGIVFDSWPETLPFQPDPRAFDPGAPDTALRAARATTGLAVHANQASARAPQVLLSAVSPDGARWTTDSLIATIRAAVALSKARLVTYENVPGDAAILPAIYVASPWLQAWKGLSFGDLAKVEWSQVAYPFLSEVK